MGGWENSSAHLPVNGPAPSSAGASVRPSPAAQTLEKKSKKIIITDIKVAFFPSPVVMPAKVTEAGNSQ